MEACISNNYLIHIFHVGSKEEKKDSITAYLQASMSASVPSAKLNALIYDLLIVIFFIKSAEPDFCT